MLTLEELYQLATVQEDTGETTPPRLLDCQNLRETDEYLLLCLSVEEHML